MFKIVPDQLRISEGWVRCGQCGEIFNASQHLVAPEAPPSAADRAPAPTPAPTPAVVTAPAPPPEERHPPPSPWVTPAAGRAITSFSTKPLHASLWVGGVTVAAALLYASFIVGRKLLFPETTLLGFPSLIALLTALFGVVMLALGLIGVYVGRIFVQTQGRPNYIIKNVE